MADQARRVAILLFNGVDVLCTGGPAAILLYASRQLAAEGAPGYQIDYFSAAGGPILTKQNLVVETRALDDVGSAALDTVIVPGGDSESYCDPRIVEWLGKHGTSVRRLAAISCGVFYLGQAGLLDGKTATTHWEECDILQARFPGVELVRDVLFTRDGGVWTSAGAASGLDVALALVEEDHGRELAMVVARRAVMFMKRPGGDPQLSPQLQSQALEGPMAPLLQWIFDHPEADLRAEALAERANMSLRNFYRAFEEATGCSPAQWVENVRLRIARRLLEQTDERVDQVARKSGFLDDERMRRCFVRRLGFTPAAYRERFCQPAPARTGGVDSPLLAEAFGLLGGRPHATLQ